MAGARRGLSARSGPGVVHLRLCRRRRLLQRLAVSSFDRPGRMGGQTQFLGQPERWSSGGSDNAAAAFRLRHDPSGSQRQDGEVGDQKSRPDHWSGPSALPATSASVQQTEGLRALRPHLWGDDSRRAPHTRRAHRDRAARRPDEPERQATVSAGADPAISDWDEGIVCPAGNSGLWRSSDLHEWRNDFSAVSTTDPAKLHYE